MHWQELFTGIDYGYGTGGRAKQEAESDGKNATLMVEGVTIKFGRSVGELRLKLESNRNSKPSGFAMSMGTREHLLEYIRQRGPIDIYINADGTINLYNDGNTRMYSALQSGIGSWEIPVRYYVPDKPSQEGTLADALQEAKAQQQLPG